MSGDVRKCRGNGGLKRERKNNRSVTLTERASDDTGGGGSPIDAAPSDAKNRPASGKIFAKNKRWITAGQAEADFIAKERECWLMEQRARLPEVRREAAYDRLVDDELCVDLAGKYARESAKRAGGQVGNIRDRYEAIVIEFACARSGGALIHDDTVDPLTLEKLEQWLYAATKAPAGYEVWPELRRTQERRALLRMLAQEYVRDRNTLMKFLRAVFERHRKVGEEHSTWRAKLCTQQLAAEYEPKDIAIELEQRGVVAVTTTPKQFDALRARVRQYRKRG